MRDDEDFGRLHAYFHLHLLRVHGIFTILVSPEISTKFEDNFQWCLQTQQHQYQCFLKPIYPPFWAGRILEWAGTFWLIINNTNLKTFLRMILRKIFKSVATRLHPLRLKCTKFNFGWGSAQTPLGELTALPQTP